MPDKVEDKELAAATQRYLAERAAMIEAGHTVHPPAGTLSTDPSPPADLKPPFRPRL